MESPAPETVIIQLSVQIVGACSPDDVKRNNVFYAAGDHELFPELHPERQPRGDRERALGVRRLVRGRREVQGVPSAGSFAL